MTFTPNRQFRREYDRLFKKDPRIANFLLLLAELSDENGEVLTTEEELCFLMNGRFGDPQAYQLNGMPKL